MSDLSPVAAPPVARRQIGVLDLVLTCDGGTTRPTRALAHAPVQLSRVRYDLAQPGAAALTLVQLGGVLAGDRYTLDVALGPAAEASITTAAATQVYRMPHGHAEQVLSLRLEAGSDLAWLPQPLILFGGADFRQTTRITLGARARLALLDVLVPGRLARGEAFAFQRYETRFEVVDTAGQLLVAERAQLVPESAALAVPGLLVDAPVVGSLWLLGATAGEQHALGEWRPPTEAHTTVQLGHTTLPNDAGVLVRAVGPTGSAVRNALLAALAALRAAG